MFLRPFLFCLKWNEAMAELMLLPTIPQYQSWLNVASVLNVPRDRSIHYARQPAFPKRYDRDFWNFDNIINFLIFFYFPGHRCRRTSVIYTRSWKWHRTLTASGNRWRVSCTSWKKHNRTIITWTKVKA